jgi:polyisoprenoid-binding protein YceI
MSGPASIFSGSCRPHRICRLGHALVAALALLLSATVLAEDAMPRNILWRVDEQQSSVVFALRALAVIGIEGRIASVQGEVWRDAKGDWVQARVLMAGLTMSSPRRRRWALSEEFFDVAHHPELVFTAKIPRGVSVDTLQGDLSGTLLLRGIEAPLVVKLAKTQCAARKTRCQVQAHGKVSRSRFGMRSRGFTLSDTVELDLQLQLRAVESQ